MKKSALCLILTLSLFAGGCEQIEKLALRKHRKVSKQEAEKAEPVVKMVEDVGLAKMILKPKPFDLKVSRDPFQSVLMEQFQDPMLDAKDLDLIESLKFLGVVKVGGEYSALLKSDEGKGVFNINDKISQLTISAINEEYVMLEGVVRTYKLKRGEN